MSPREALAQAVHRLEAAGFTVAARNERGDSVYLARDGEPFSLRVSNHGRTPKQRRNHPEVLASLVIRESRTAAQVEAMVAASLRDFRSALARHETGSAPN